MRATRLLILALGLAGAISCMDGPVLPADPTHSGAGLGVSTGGGSTSGVASHTVTVGDNFFAPAALTVFVSDTVTWVWAGNNPHSVTFSDGTSSGDRTSGTFQRFFGTTGTFPYRSTTPTDSAVTGTITVLAR